MTATTAPAATATSVPFSALVAKDDINARLTGKTDEIDGLAASIEAKGLIQALAVRPGKKSGTFEIIDGRRRYAALGSLVKSKKFSKDAPVPVLIRDEDNAHALETSLAANTVRLPMHPIDQHEVFARLEDEGAAPA